MGYMRILLYLMYVRRYQLGYNVFVYIIYSRPQNNKIVLRNGKIRVDTDIPKVYNYRLYRKLCKFVLSLNFML